MSDEQEQAKIDLMKEMVTEIKELRQRVVSLETQNTMLTKSLDDPETMMKKAGWLKVVTPMADEAYDPPTKGCIRQFSILFRTIQWNGGYFSKAIEAR